MLCQEDLESATNTPSGTFQDNQYPSLWAIMLLNHKATLELQKLTRYNRFVRVLVPLPHEKPICSKLEVCAFAACLCCLSLSLSSFYLSIFLLICLICSILPLVFFPFSCSTGDNPQSQTPKQRWLPVSVTSRIIHDGYRGDATVGEFATKLPTKAKIPVISLRNEPRHKTAYII